MERKLISDCSLFLEKYNVNVFKLSEWQQIIGSEIFSEQAYMELVNYFALDAMQQGDSFASAKADLKIVYYLENELYKMLSSEKNRGKAEILTSALISAVATNVANQYQVDVFIVTGLTDLIALGILKIGINAWCRYFEEKYKKDLHGE